MRSIILSFLLIGLLTLNGGVVLGAEVTGTIGTNAGVSATAPSAPTGLAVSASSGTATALSWTAVSGADSYKVYRQTVNNGFDSAVAIASSSSNSYSDSGLSSGVYYYRVKTVDAGIDSEFSSVVSVSVDGAGSSSSSSSGGGGGGGGGSVATAVTTTTTTLSADVKKYDIDGDDKIGLKDLNNILFNWGTDYGILDLNTLLFNWSV